MRSPGNMPTGGLGKFMRCFLISFVSCPSPREAGGGKKSDLCFLIPLQNLLAVPVQHALVAVDVIIDRFEIFDAVRLAADVRMNGKRDDLGALFALFIEPVEL